MDIALADPNELAAVRRVNCRHCNGVGHAYQYTDPTEFAKAVAAVMDENVGRQSMRPKRAPKELPTDAGGYGFNSIADPHVNCPKCHGEGIARPWIADTRKLKGRARKLYAGYRITKDGRIEVKTRDQDAALANIAKALGMFTENVNVLQPGGKPVGVPALPIDEVEASRRYQEFVKGEKT